MHISHIYQCNPKFIAIKKPKYTHYASCLGFFCDTLHYSSLCYCTLIIPPLIPLLYMTDVTQSDWTVLYSPLLYWHVVKLATM